MKLLKKVSLIVLVVSYLLAGANHFRKPGSYINIIPDYMPFPKLMNILSGGGEILFGSMLISARTRVLGAWGIIILLILFLPVHIDMVIRAPFHLGSLYVTPLIAWMRLVVLQPLLIVWARWHTKD